MCAELQLYNRPELDLFFGDFKDRYNLTAREIEVVKALAFHGENNKELGDRFNISEKTLKNHMANIFEKTRLKSSRELQALIFRYMFKYRVFASMFQAAPDWRGMNDAALQDRPVHQLA